MPGMAPRNVTPSLPTASLQGQALHPQPAQSHATRNTEHCTSPNCSRLRNRLCTLKMCKKCCTSRSTGCSVTSHSTAKLSQKLPVFTLPSDVTPLPTDRGWDALNLLIDQDPTVKLFRAEEERKKAEAREHQIEEERECEEDAVLAAAIAASLASPTPPPLMLKSPNPARLLPPLLTPSRPVLPPPPPLPAPSQATKKLPTITNHLDSNWRRAHNDRSKEAQARKGKAQGDPAIIQKFFIMFWAQVCHLCIILHPMLTNRSRVFHLVSFPFK